MTLEQLFAEHVQRRPDGPALIDLRGSRPRTITFHALAGEVDDAAAWLRAEGFRPGQSVLILVPMSAELYIALMAMLRLGLVAIFLDPSAGRGHIEQCCGRWMPDAFLGVPKAHLLRLRCPSLRRIARHYVVYGWAPWAQRWRVGPRQAAEVAEPASWPAEHPALVTFTSGSTGEPKGAVRTHGFLRTQFLVLAPHIDLRPGDIDLATLPIFVLANLAAGATTIIPDVDVSRPAQIPAKRFMRILREYHVSRLTGSPALLERLIFRGLWEGRGIPSLRIVLAGGAPVFPRVLKDLEVFAPEARLVAVYGSTEAEPIAHLDASALTYDDLTKMWSGGGLLVGRPIPQIRVRILEDRWGTPLGAMSAAAFRRDQCETGRIGEIVVTGPHVLRGYLGGIGDTETKFTVDGEVWHRTGDAGRIDREGRLWLLGRCSARLDDDRGRLYPLAVECLVMRNTDVLRAAAVLHEGARWLLIQPRKRRLRGSKLRILRGADWAMIDHVRVVKRIPVDRRHNAKIDYVALQELLEEDAKR